MSRLRVSIVGLVAVLVTCTTLVALPGVVQAASRDYYFLTEPSMSGEAVVGSTLTVNPGALARNGSTYPSSTSPHVAWNINGQSWGLWAASSTTLELTPKLVGARIYAVVTHNTGDQFSQDSLVTALPTVTVQPAPMVVSKEPTLVGSGRVGEPLTVDPGLVAPADAEVSYSWFRSDVPFPAASGSSYTPTADDLMCPNGGWPERRCRFYVEVRYSKSGYKNELWYAYQEGEMELGRFAATEPSVADRAPRVGESFQVNLGTVTPEPASVSYEWVDAAGSSQAGGTSVTRVVSEQDFAHGLKLRVTYSRAGFEPFVEERFWKVAQGSLKVSRNASIRGKLRVRQVLSAVPVFTSPSAGQVSYQWLRNGKLIRGAASARYKLRAVDKGKRIGVRVRVTRAAYAPVVKTVTRVGKVKPRR